MSNLVTHSFGSMSDYDVMEFGLTAGEHSFMGLKAMGILEGDSLYLNAGIIVNGQYLQLGTRAIGPAAWQYANDVNPLTGCLATVVDLEMGSLTASRFSKLRLSRSRGLPGGVFHLAEVSVNGRWYEQKFAGAASGVQGHFNIAIVQTVLSTAAAAWAERTKAVAL